MDTMLDKCFITTNTASGSNNNQPRRPRINKQTQTVKQKDTTPKFINPSTAISMDTDTTSIGSGDEFQIDALELGHGKNTSQSTLYPSRKYSYPSTANTNTPTERAWSPGFSDTIPLLTNYGK